MAHSTTRQSKKERFGAYAKTALSILGVGAGLVAIIAFPGLAVVAKEFLQYRKQNPYRVAAMKATLRRLKARGFVCVVEKGDELFLQLTPKGKAVLKELKFDALSISKPKQWDGVWHLVAFDIPEKKCSTRVIFRTKLKKLGFSKLEKSIFIHPYPCQTEIAFLVNFLRIGSFVHYISATTFNGDRRWRSYYKLS